MKLLQIKVSKKQLEEINATKNYSMEVTEAFDKVFESENGQIVEDPDYDQLSLVKKYDGILFIQCRSKYPFAVSTVTTESLGYRPFAAEDGPYAQAVTYTLADAISKEELTAAEIVEL